MTSITKQRSVTVTLRVKIDGTWRRLPAAYGRNGRIRPGYALIDDRQVGFAEPAYEIRLYENRQTKYIPVGRNATDAEARRKKEELAPSKTKAKSIARDAGLQITDTEDRRTLVRSARDYLHDAQQRGAMEAAEQARLVSSEFLALTGGKTYIDEITRDDIFRFHAALRKRGCRDRTVANKHQRLTSWLRFAGIDRTILPPTPKYEEKLPTIYDRDQISTLLAEAGPYIRVAILLGLKCGLRDRELMHAEFSDINRSEKTFRVQGKPQWKFKVKTHEQRDVPVPDALLEELKNWKAHRAGKALILGTGTEKPNTKLLLMLKNLARKAKLNCGRCAGCRSKNRACGEYTLHRFRRTYITTLLRNGVDLRTVQAYAGHKDIASTMRYLRPASAKEAQAKLNAIEW